MVPRAGLGSGPLLPEAHHAGTTLGLKLELLDATQNGGRQLGPVFLLGIPKAVVCSSSKNAGLTLNLSRLDFWLCGLSSSVSSSAKMPIVRHALRSCWEHSMGQHRQHPKLGALGSIWIRLSHDEITVDQWDPVNLLILNTPGYQGIVVSYDSPITQKDLKAWTQSTAYVMAP